ncbi:MAG: hypothetical protein DYG94_13435 [Leptolyngbya sp. PLA3]|nr:MAG: hypothetical protein EDM82_13990 [Cyanobacteria bacterium CYA]MCE7969728.1 hypothetical protein [Leptolyngbya sp. PL-A3]
MSTVPKTIADRLAFYEQHAPVWAAAATTIGLSVTQVTALAALVNDARVAFDDAQAARNASKAATVLQANAMSTLSDFGADLIKTIRAYAETNNNPDVYATAQIPPPAPPTPAGPPDMPTDLAASFLFPWGIRLTWKGSVAQGAYFGVFRRLRGESNFTFVQTTKEKSFDDTSLPAGVASVDYYIAAFRDQYQVNSAAIALQFAPAAGGGTTVTSLGLAA